MLTESELEFINMITRNPEKRKQLIAEKEKINGDNGRLSKEDLKVRSFIKKINSKK